MDKMNVILSGNEIQTGEMLKLHEFCLSGGGTLEQWDGLVNLDHGTLYVDGDYILRCNGILQMIQEDDLLRVKGSFETQSFMNYSSMLWNGRMELLLLPVRISSLLLWAVVGGSE